jgi:FAD/FMN-containing dehydrogenase
VELVPELRSLVGENAVLTGERLASRVYDKHVGTVAARVLVRPSTTEQVSAVLRLCHSRAQPVVPHGGLTGLVYGCSARENELLLSLEALNQIESVDVAGRTMRVQAGVTLQRVQEEAERLTSCFRWTWEPGALPPLAATSQPTPVECESFVLV